MSHLDSPRKASKMYMGGCIFVNRASGHVQVEHQVGLNSHETLKAKKSFETSIGVQSYLSDNGTFASKAYEEDLQVLHQHLRFAGVVFHALVLFLATAGLIAKIFTSFLVTDLAGCFSLVSCATLFRRVCFYNWAGRKVWIFDSHATDIRNVGFIIYCDPKKVNRDVYSADLAVELNAPPSLKMTLADTTMPKMQTRSTGDSQNPTYSDRKGSAAEIVKAK
jgi:hypothetical protein